MVLEAFQYHDGKRYELDALVVMPNHVHLLVRPLDDAENSLEKVLQNRKGHIARKLNALLERSGDLWQQESFDRIVRDDEHLWRCLQYLGDNPRRASLFSGYLRWVRPEWERIGWKFVLPNL